MSSEHGEINLKQDYKIIRKLRDESEIISFLKQRMPTPDKDEYYNPQAHEFETSNYLSSVRYEEKQHIGGMIALQLLVALIGFIGIVVIVCMNWGNSFWHMLVVTAPVFIVTGPINSYLQGKIDKAEREFNEGWRCFGLVHEKFIEPDTEWVESRYLTEEFSYSGISMFHPETAEGLEFAENSHERKKDDKYFQQRMDIRHARPAYLKRKTKSHIWLTASCNLDDKSYNYGLFDIETRIEAPLRNSDRNSETTR